MTNTIQHANKYANELDKMIVQESKTGFLADGKFKAQFTGAKTVNIKMGDITISGVVDKDSKEIVREIADEQVKEFSDEIADVLNHS